VKDGEKPILSTLFNKGDSFNMPDRKGLSLKTGNAGALGSWWTVEPAAARPIVRSRPSCSIRKSCAPRTAGLIRAGIWRPRLLPMPQTRYMKRPYRLH